jgi:F-type H+-transporting ATPase subunit delta
LNDAVATRYAAALTDVALEQNDANRVKRDLDSFVSAFAESADLRAFIESPGISHELKHKVIGELALRMDLVGAVRNFAFLVVDHHRTEMLGEIREAFQRELNARLGIAEAEVTSAREMSEEEREKLTAALERRTGKRIEARFHRNESLVGGTVVRVGSTVYDGSVREQLVRLREQLETE